MYFEEIPFYETFSEVRKKVTDIVLSASDTVEFLGCSEYGLQEIYDLYGTKYEDIIPALINVKSGESYGMWGKIFRFKLEKALCNHIRQEGLSCIFRENGELFLENLYLYKGESVIFSCCSHEVLSLYHMAEIDNSLLDMILLGINETIRQMPLYEDMKKVAGQLISKTKSEIKKDISIILDLCWFVDKEKGYFVYSSPKYECDFAVFKTIAKSYLTKNTYAVLSTVSSFSELQPFSVPNTAEDVLNGTGKNVPQFIHSNYYNKVKRELKMLEYILGIN